MLKQVFKFLIEDDHLPASVAFKYPLKKADGTDTYCWWNEEVQAIIEHCQTEELRCWGMLSSDWQEPACGSPNRPPSAGQMWIRTRR